MNAKIISAIAIYYVFSGSVQGRNLLNQKEKSSPDWLEALDEFKALAHAITFGEQVPSHHNNPLQMMLIHEEKDSKLSKPSFKIPNVWIAEKTGVTLKSRSSGKKLKQMLTKSKKINQGKKTMKMKPISSLQIRKQQSLDDLALLDFLVKLENPNSRVITQNSQNKKHLNSLIMAENRYNEIKKKLKISKHSTKKGEMQSKSKKFLIEPVKIISDKSEKKEWFRKIDEKSLKHTLTLSVAFGVIVTALFCVAVQLFKLFASSKSSGSSGAFDQINRRSTHGYDRIALDIEEDEETTHLN